MSFVVQDTSLRLPPKPPDWVTGSVTVLAILAVVSIRQGFLGGRPIGVGYSLALLLFVWLRSKPLLWLATLVFLASHYVEAVVRFPIPGRSQDALYLDYFITAFNLIAIALVIHLMIVAVDSADRRSRQLSRALAELAAVWRTAPVGLCVTDATFSDFRLNPQGAALLGVPPDENVAALVSTNGFANYRDGRPVSIDQTPLFRAARDNTIVEAQEWEIAGPSGRRVTVLIAAAPVRVLVAEQAPRFRRSHDPVPATAPASGAVAAFVDITAAKDLQRELDLRRREAEEASVRKSRFLSAVSHDIRTPANAISLLAELLGHAATTPGMTAEIPKFAADLRSSSRKLVDLVSDVLDFTKLDTARVEIVESVFDLRTLLDEECTQAQVLGAQKGLAVRCVLPDHPTSVRTDRVKLGRIIGNLLSNAVKFTAHGEVTLSADRNPAGDILIRVTDTGIGIPPDSLSRIFDEFYQVRSNSTSRDPTRAGSGLGLAICKRLSAAMGLRLDVDSQPNHGTTFTLTLPEPLTMLPPARG